MKLGVCYPWSSPFMFTGFVDTTLNMEHPEGVKIKYFRGAGWCPAKRHINMCQQAFDWGADLICIIGADQEHPEDMLIRLVDRFNEGYEVVTAMIPCRGYVHWIDMKPFQPMAWRWKTNTELGDSGTESIRQYRGMGLDGNLLHVIDPEDGEMQRVNFIGSGVLMFHRDHLRAIKKPWFREAIDFSTFKRIASMDTTFVWRLQTEAHAKVWVDTTIKVKHDHVFKIDDTYQDRFGDWGWEDQRPDEVFPPVKNGYNRQSNRM